MSPFRLAWRLSWKGAVTWSAVTGLLVLTAVSAYESAYQTELSRRVLLNDLASKPALNALYGYAASIDTPGGFLSWRYGGVLSVIVALWALLTVTRVLRGDEEAGRSDLLVASRVSARALLDVQLRALAVAVLVVAAGTGLGGVLGGLPVGGSLLFGLMVGGAGALFGALAAVTSQLFSTRRRAAGWAGALLGAAFLVRAVGDAAASRRWVTWLSPLGWIERISPFVHPSAIAILVVVGCTAALVVVAFVVRARRDTGEGVLGAGRRRAVRSHRLRSPLALDWRLARGVVVAWAAGIAIASVVFGYLAADVAQYFHDDENVNDVARRISGASGSTVDGFLGLTFSAVALALAVFVGLQILAARREEASGRGDELLTSGISRIGWLVPHLLVGVMAALGLAVVAGLGAWMGTALNGGTATNVGDSLRGALNVVPVALVFGAITLLCFGLLPRATAAVAFGSVAFAYLVLIVGATAQVPHWILDVSPFSHVAAVPAAAANLGAAAVMLVAAVVLGGAGVASFLRRDTVAE